MLSSVVGVAGVSSGALVMLAMRALDAYTVAVSLANAQRYRMTLATTLDDGPMSIGRFGPFWAAYDAGRLPDFREKPLTDRFALCP